MASSSLKKPWKIVVFDLDETLGCFIQLSLFWDVFAKSLKYQIPAKHSVNQDDFNHILDLFPEFLRPFLIPLLENIKTQKERGLIDKVILFTNNQGEPSWARRIVHYLEYRIQGKLFDKVIGAYKVNNVLNEPCRTSHEKSYTDLLRCANIDQPNQVCFVDDLVHQGMVHPNVYYIQVTPYSFHVPMAAMVERLLRSPYGKQVISKPIFFKYFALAALQKYKFKYEPKSKASFELDKIASRQMEKFIHHFVDVGSPI